jgi:hypothetical protein
LAVQIYETFILAGNSPLGGIEEKKEMKRIPKLASCGTMMLIALASCAGRAPQPVAVVQIQDRYMDCSAIIAEAHANNQKVQELASEEGSKVRQNVAAGVAGLFIWPLWFAMDFQGAAGKEVTALQSRQQYLGTMAEQKQCAFAGSAPTALIPPRSPPAATPTPAASAAAIPAAQPISTARPATANPAGGAATVGPASAGQTVLFPVTINNPYHPSWTYNAQ